MTKSISCTPYMPIGVSDFKKLITFADPIGQGYYFVDKSLLIRKLLYDPSEVLVFTRPRRFGKTLNLSMLEYFFTIEDCEENNKLFTGLNISAHPDCMQYQGKYPVIFLTLKSVKETNMKSALSTMKNLIRRVFSGFLFLLKSDKISEDDKIKFNEIIAGVAGESDYKEALLMLSKLLYQHYGKRVILLLDEYDTPIQEAYLEGYYEEFIKFIQGLFGNCLKDNKYLYRAVLTGILRISKESLFSNLNNIKINSVLSIDYTNYFGFTEEEVKKLLIYKNLQNKIKLIKSWYNGYDFGGLTIYNPWSMINFIAAKQINYYWLNTSGNDLIKALLENVAPDEYKKLVDLISGKAITVYINEHMVFQNLKGQTNIAPWSLLLMAGYLKVVNRIQEIVVQKYQAKIPNKEVEFIYHQIFSQWCTNNRDLLWYERFLDNLVTGKVEAFAEQLQMILEEIVSYHDASKKSQESFYHGLVLGLITGLKEDYIIRSNKESGNGRYDLAIIPFDKTKIGILLEFKAVKSNKILNKNAKIALQQIKSSNYAQELKQQRIEQICSIGIAFSGKGMRYQYSLEKECSTVDLV